jgi:uncharacterized membrane protein
MNNDNLESDRKRALVKAVTYRFFGTTLSALIAWTISHDLRISLGVFTFDGIGKIALYYLHERAWNYIPWGHPEAGHHEKLSTGAINEQHSQPGEPNLA